VLDIPEGYVVFDRARRQALPALMRWYVERGVLPLGRYGAVGLPLRWRTASGTGGRRRAWVLRVAARGRRGRGR
jgi:hypothetical protein